MLLHNACGSKKKKEVPPSCFPWDLGQKLGLGWRGELSIPKVSRCVSVQFTSLRMISKQGCSIRTRKQAGKWKKNQSLLLVFLIRKLRTFPSSFWPRVRLRTAASKVPGLNWLLSRSLSHPKGLNSNCEDSAILTSASPRGHNAGTRISLYKLGAGQAFRSVFSFFGSIPRPV